MKNYTIITKIGHILNYQLTKISYIIISNDFKFIFALPNKNMSVRFLLGGANSLFLIPKIQIY